MDWLEPPYQFFHPHPGMPFDVPVSRWEVGLAQREISEPPYSVIKLTIRFHLPAAGGWGLRPYVDFTNQILLQHILHLYRQMIDRRRSQVPFPDSDLLEALDPAEPRPVVLRLRRLGTGINTVYDVDVVGT